MAMPKFFLFTISLALLLSSNGVFEAAPERSLVTQLPGFNGTFPSNHYSGYIYIYIYLYMSPIIYSSLLLISSSEDILILFGDVEIVDI